MEIRAEEQRKFRLDHEGVVSLPKMVGVSRGTKQFAETLDIVQHASISVTFIAEAFSDWDQCKC